MYGYEYWKGRSKGEDVYRFQLVKMMRGKTSSGANKLIVMVGAKDFAQKPAVKRAIQILQKDLGTEFPMDEITKKRGRSAGPKKAPEAPVSTRKKAKPAVAKKTRRRRSPAMMAA